MMDEKTPLIRLTFFLNKKDRCDLDFDLVTQILSITPTETAGPRIWRRRVICDPISEDKTFEEEGVELAGRGQGSLPALFAALVSDDVAAVKLWDAPESYQSMVEKRFTMWPQSCMVPGILEYMDLPDIYEAVAAFKPFAATFVSEPLPEM